MSFDGDQYAESGASVVMTTKGDLVRYDSARERYGIGSTGQVLTVVSGLPAWATTSGGTSFNEIVRKTSDQTNNTTTLASDSELKLAIGVSKTFIFQFNCILHEKSTSDIKLTVTAPTNATGGYANTRGVQGTGALNDFGDVQATSVSTNTICQFVVAGWCTTDGSNSGDIQFQFAENSSNASGV